MEIQYAIKQIINNYLIKLNSAIPGAIQGSLKEKLYQDLRSESEEEDKWENVDTLRRSYLQNNLPISMIPSVFQKFLEILCNQIKNERNKLDLEGRTGCYFICSNLIWMHPFNSLKPAIDLVNY